LSGIYERRGGEALANTATAGEQDQSRIAYLSDGRFVIVWRDASRSGGDTSGTAIRGQIFNADGTRSGTEFLVNTATAGDQGAPTLAALAGGGFAVSWTDSSTLGDGSGSSVKVQIFDSAGAPAGGEFVANTSTALGQGQSSMAASAGGFVLVWADGGSNASDIKAQRFDAAGAKIGTELLVNTQVAGTQFAPVVTVLTDGRFVVTWMSGSIKAQLFNADGTMAGAEFTVTPATQGGKGGPSVTALAGGGFAIAWEDNDESAVTGGPGIRVQVYDSAGTALGADIKVHTEDYGSQYGAFVAGLADGGFVVTWTDTSGRGADLSSNGVKAQQFDSAGARVGGEFLVNVVTGGRQYASGIAAKADGFTIVWRDLSGQDPSGAGVKFGRFVLSPATAAGDEIVGTGGADHIHGLDGDDILSGLGDSDLIEGGAGSDRLDGGDGGDVLRGDQGDDLIDGGSGNDRLEGGDGDDVLGGGIGNDAIEGGEGDDALDGSDGNDSLTGGAGVDGLVGGAGDDMLDGGDGQDMLDGGDGIDSLLGGAADDTLRGGAGADLLDGGADNDTLHGGDGDDRLLHTASVAAAGWDLASGDSGHDTLVADFRAVTAVVAMAAPSPDGFGGYSGSISTGAGQLSFTGIEAFVITGGSAGDGLIGGDGHDSLTGLAGHDRLEGGNGNDVLDGGTGSDLMIGGLGDDVYHTDSAADQMTEAADSGNDTIWTSRNLTLGANFENLRGSGTFGLMLTGNGGDNFITGTWGRDFIDGGAGADRMEGGPGGDTYYVDNSGDVVFDNDYDPAKPYDYFEPPAIDEVRVSITTYSLVGTGSVDNLVGLLATGHVLTGNGLDNRITGNSGDDRIDGGAGRDTMIGGAGNDVYVVDNVSDRVQEVAGGGIDEVLVGVNNYELPSEVENGTLTIVGFTTLYGNALGNILRGTAESETFDGRGGADTMIGGLGGDTYYVDNAGDQVIEAPGDVGFWDDKVYTSLAYYEIPVGVELLEGTSATQTLVGSDEGEWIISAGGGDTMIGRGGDDLYYVSAGDTVVELEGGGIDIVRTTLASYTLPDNVEQLQAVSFSIGQTLIGNALDNLIIGTLLNDRTDIIDGGLGADRMIGYHGSDIYYVDDAGDVVVEESHHGTADEVRTSLARYTLAANVEKLTATTDAAHDFRGNAGNNVITGGAGNDHLRLQDGGNDTVSGAGGDDAIYMIGSLTAADVINGGDGNDTLVLQGNYAGGLTLSANVTNIELISILAGSNTNFGEPGTNRYDYVLTVNDANFSGGIQVRINGSALLAGEDFTFNGSAELDSRFVIYGGRGKDSLTGSQNADIFFFAEERFSTGDTVNGGAGYDGMFLRGNYTIDFNAPGYTGLFTNIENLTLTSATDERYARGGGTEFDYNLVLSNAIVKPGETLTVSGALLMANETMIVDAGAETDGFLSLFGGKSGDTLKGGALADLIHGNLGADILAGNGGADVFRYQDVGESTASSLDHILDFAAGIDKVDLSRIDADTNSAGNQAFSWIGSNAFSGSAGQLRAYQDGASWFVEGDTNGDGVADLVIQLTVTGGPLSQGDFLP
jgi:Ca2+-binding RTX toxin-like protein